MKLVYSITIRLSVALLFLMAVWATVFYFVILNEINDETDDSLEDYSEMIIMRALAGEPLPSNDNGSNNTYYIKEITPEYAWQNKDIRYFDEMIYIEAKQETEPARILKTIFCDTENNYFELTVAIPTIDKEDLIETILEWLIFLYLVLLLAIIIINIWVFYRSFKPLYKLLNWINNFNVGEKMIPLENDTKIIEFQKLNDAVLDNAKRNIKIYEQQKEFIENASHELQTPLAVCQNQLEMLSEDSSFSEKQLHEIFEIEAALERVIKLNKTLLLLTKIESGQFIEKEEINMNKLLSRLVDDYSEIYSYRNVTLRLEEKDKMRFKMNEMLASVLFANLLKNAYIHNVSGGNITIEIYNGKVIFSNSSPGDPLNPDEIFKRFYKEKGKSGSSGLGLAIVESICKLYNIGLSYRFKDNKHFFILSFQK
jgi:signal transduction histidine kinase